MPVLQLPGDVVGREGELGAVIGLLAHKDHRLYALSIEGEAGIGKTTLWETGKDVAAAAGLLVLSCQAEAKLAFAALADPMPCGCSVRTEPGSRNGPEARRSCPVELGVLRQPQV